MYDCNMIAVIYTVCSNRTTKERYPGRLNI